MWGLIFSLSTSVATETPSEVKHSKKRELPSLDRASRKRGRLPRVPKWVPPQLRLTPPKETTEDRPASKHSREPSSLVLSRYQGLSEPKDMRNPNTPVSVDSPVPSIGHMHSDWLNTNLSPRYHPPRYLVLQLWLGPWTNHLDFLGRQLFLLCPSVLGSKLSSLVTQYNFNNYAVTYYINSLPQDKREQFQAFISEGQLIAKTSLQAALNTAETTSYSLAVVMR